MHHETDTGPGPTAGPTAGPTTGPGTGAPRAAGAAPGGGPGGPAPAPAREVRVVVDGELDLATAPHLLERVRVVLAAGAAAVVLDLSAVEFVDCSGLRGLVLARALLLAAGCTVTVPAPSPAVARLLSWTSMTEHVTPGAPVHP